jgi:DNA-binding response OmpR family regulator
MADLLLVDDDTDLTELLSDALRAEGHRVRIACNGQDGLRQLGQRRPDLVLLDVEMPLLTGPEMALRMLIHDCGDEKVPIVLLSATVGLAQVAAVVGTPYFLGKPYLFEQVLAIAQRALDERLPPRPAAPPAA